MGLLSATCTQWAAGLFAALSLLAFVLHPAVASAQGFPGWGYVWADNPTAASYTPNLTYTGNPSNSPVSITRTGMGQYTVSFQNFGGHGQAGGNVQVTAYGGYNEYCKVVNWNSSGTDFLVNVHCFTPLGYPVDTRFDAQAIWPISRLQHGFAWADQPTAASYTPSSTYAYNAAGGPITITRSGAGLYAVRFANLGGHGVAGGTVQVTAYGSDSAHCKVDRWSSAGPDFIADVRCFTAAGDPVDTYYSVRAWWLVAIASPNSYTFTLESFTIYNTMAWHTDTDYVYFTVKVGNQVFGPQHAKIGDLNNGTYPLHWSFGPIPAAENTPVLLTYQILNHGHADNQKQLDDDIEIANAIADVVSTIGGAVYPPAAPVLSAIATGLQAVGKVLSWVFDHANCDGMVLSDAMTTTGSTLRDWSNTSTGIHTETRRYRGPETPWGCGSDADYSVTWSITPTRQ
jgi:hypothetical protein